MQHDGNLVIYAGTNAVWSTHTSRPESRLFVQDDGNVVIHDRDGKEAWSLRKPGTLGPGENLPAWEALSSPSGKYTLLMQGDGDLVLYDQRGHAVWASHTFS